MPRSLKRIVGTTFGIATVIGSSVGIGILKWPGTIAGYTTSEILFIAFWVIGGLLSLTGSYIYAEMGTRIPKAGGPFVLGRAAFGNGGGFLTGWMDIIMNTSSIAYLAIAVIEYFIQLTGYNLNIGFAASILIVLIAIIQWHGLKQSSTLQIIMSLAKTVCLLIFVIACLIYYFNGNRNPVDAHTSIVSPVPLFTALILSLRSVFLAYTGWNSAIYFTEEDKDPGKNLPRSMAYGVISIIVIYVLVNLGLLAVLPLQKMAGTDMAAADAAGIIFGRKGGLVVTAIGIISILGVLYATMLFTPRIIFAVAKAGFIPTTLAGLNMHAIPGSALILITGISVIFASTGLFNVIVSISALFGILIDLFVYVAYLVVRRKHPDHHYLARGFPFNGIIMTLISLGLVIGLFVEDGKNSIYSIILLGAGIILYRIAKKYIKEKSL